MPEPARTLFQVRYSVFLSPSLAALLAISLTIPGCNGVSKDDVARIDAATISKSTFDRWVVIAAASNAEGEERGLATAPDPPRYVRCIRRNRAEAAARNRSAGTREELMKKCSDAYEALKTQVMQFLIRSEWLELQAKEMNIAVGDAEVRSEFAKARKQAFPDNKAYIEFLKRSGQTEADLLFRQRSQLLEQRITDRVTSRHSNPKSQQKALSAFGIAYQRKWRAETECQEGFVVADCGNGPNGRGTGLSVPNPFN